MVLEGLYETGRFFIYDSQECELVTTIPDHDDWAVWAEHEDHEGYWYVSDHEDYMLDDEEFWGGEPHDDSMALTKEQVDIMLNNNTTKE